LIESKWKEMLKDNCTCLHNAAALIFFAAILCSADSVQTHGDSLNTTLSKHELVTNECYDTAKLPDGLNSELITCTTRGSQGILHRPPSPCYSQSFELILSKATFKSMLCIFVLLDVSFKYQTWTLLYIMQVG